jgi:ankyrin repeat protein
MCRFAVADTIQGIRCSLLFDATSRPLCAGGELARPVNSRVSLNDTSNLEMMRMLIDGGVGLDEIGSSSYAPLHNAVRSNDLLVARLLIRRGANVNFEANNMTLLQFEGAAIFFAASVEMVQLLVEAGADLTRMKGGSSVLEVVAGQKDVAIVRFLIQAAKDNGVPFRRPFFHRASPASGKFFIEELDCDVDAEYNPGGATALSVAALHSNVDMVRFLLACGAAVDTEFPFQTKAGAMLPHTAIEICRTKNEAAILLAAGAKKGKCRFDPSADEIAKARRLA